MRAGNPPRTLRDTVEAWDPSWIVYEDEALIAVAKPAGMPSQSARRADDDVVSRLRAYLSLRDGEPEPYLGVHQRLDQETSGVLVLSRMREANPALAKQFEEREVEKTYVAWVGGRFRGERRLEHGIRRLRGGRVEVTPPGADGSKRAITLVRAAPDEAAPRPGATRLSIRIETGRTHQIRAQLAEAGMPILGDALYGGGDAGRLMLHAQRLRLRHPLSDEPLILEAPELDAPMALAPDSDADVVGARVRDACARAAHRRFTLFRADREERATDAFRWLHGDAEGLPGLDVDVYGDHLVLHVSAEPFETCEEAVVAALASFQPAGIYVKRRPRQANTLVDTRRAEVAPAAPILGEAAPDPLVVRENGIPYHTRLGDGLSTGIFLDQRAQRAWVREHVAGLRVLNLFAYTGAFSVAAAVGRAREIVTVDVAAPALTWAREQLDAALEALSITLDERALHRVIREDAFTFLERVLRREERFDLVIADPPTYSSTKKGKRGTRRWSSGSGWVTLAEAAARAASEHGVLLLSSNDRRMSQAQFRRYVREGLERAGREGRLRDNPPGEDFPIVPSLGEPYLASLRVELTPSAPSRRPSGSRKGDARRRRGSSRKSGRGRGGGTNRR